MVADRREPDKEIAISAPRGAAAGNAGIQTRLDLWATHHNHIHVSLKWW